MIKVSLTYTFTREPKTVHTKQGGVMPRELKIINGPGFKQLAFNSGIFGEYSSHCVFYLDQPIPKGMTTINGPNALQGAVRSFTKNDYEDNGDNFTLILKNSALQDKIIKNRVIGTKVSLFYYVLHYNCRTRRGTAIEYTVREFFSGKAMKDLVRF